MQLTQLNIPVITELTSTRYVKRDNSIKSSNFEMNLNTLNAYSYNWWLFCTRFNGKVIFNNTTYSMSTCKHQNKAWRVLNYQSDLTLVNTRKSLSDLQGALNDEIKNTKAGILELINTIRKPRTRKSTNQERRKKINAMIKHIYKVRKFKSEVL